MIPDPGGLQAHLNGRNYYDSYETFAIAGVATFSTRGSPPVERGPVRNSLGNAVATCEFTILCGGGASILTDALSGAWDGLGLVVSRVFVGSATVVRFTGVVAEVRPTSVSLTVIGKSLITEMTKNLPVRGFSSVCPWVYGSAACAATGALCEHTIETCSGNFGGFRNIPGKYKTATYED